MTPLSLRYMAGSFPRLNPQGLEAADLTFPSQRLKRLYLWNRLNPMGLEAADLAWLQYLPSKRHEATAWQTGGASMHGGRTELTY